MSVGAGLDRFLGGLSVRSITSLPLPSQTTDYEVQYSTVSESRLPDTVPRQPHRAGASTCVAGSRVGRVVQCAETARPMVPHLG